MIKAKALALLLVVASISGCASSQIEVTSLPEKVTRGITSIYQTSHFNCYEDVKFPRVLNAYENIENDLLLVVTIPNYLCRDHAFLTIIRKANGQWGDATYYEGNPETILSLKDGIVFSSHWEVEGSYPMLHYYSSSKGMTPIPLPNRQKVDCCTDWLDNLVLSKDTLHIRFAEQENTPATNWRIHFNEFTRDFVPDSPIWTQENDEVFNSLNKIQSKGTKWKEVIVEGEANHSVQQILTSNGHIVLNLPPLIPIIH